MKNLMIYISPNKSFEEERSKNGKFLWRNETETLLKIQIDNSLALGWKSEDILIILNFPWEYNGIKAIEVPDSTYCDFAPTASKINVIKYMFDNNMIGDDLYWFHDIDAFQLTTLDEDVKDEIALTDYGAALGINKEDVSLRWSTGVLFFRKEAKHVFDLLYHGVNNSYRKNEETALLAMMRCDYAHISKWIRKINITNNFSFRLRDLDKQYEMADKPLKVIHLHPFDPRTLKYGNTKIENNMAAFPQYATPLLIDIFKKHGLCK